LAKRNDDIDMTKIRIHRFENQKWGRAHLPFFKKFDEYLKKYFDVDVVNYNTDGTTFSGKIELINPVGHFGNNPPISDVENVIENLETGETKLLSFSKFFNNHSSHITKSDSCTKTLLAHFTWSSVYYWMKRENAIKHLHKISPWIFLTFADFDVEFYRNKRKTIDTFNDKIFWLGGGVDNYRKMIRVLSNKGYMQPLNSVPIQTYFERLISSKVGLSYYLDLDKNNTPFDHPGEMCYRDIEYCLLGLPYIRIEYKSSLYDPLLPNVHYVSIPREHAYVAYDKNGDEGLSELFIQRYSEVINDQDFLNYISQNQIKWSDKNLMNDNKEKLTFELLELKNWIK